MKLATVAALVSLIWASAGAAQTRSVRDTATAYGARLNAKGQPAVVNQNRINNRINNRIDNRIGMRIERYQPEAMNDPTGTLRTRQDDKSRTVPVVAPQPMTGDGPEQ